MGEAILREGDNCWARAHAARAAVLVDAARYFEVLADAIERAERSIVLIGWDFHSRVRLRRGGGEDAAEQELLALLERQVRRRRTLRVHILAWDFAMIYALEREWQPLYRFDWTTHRRITCRLDGAHPLGASQHQKIVVVDDAIAFSGGLDVTVCRWDTPEHPPEDDRRSDPGYESYGAFHDVQMAVDGDAARALGELARERWRIATGRSLPKVRPSSGDPWPRGLLPDFRDVDVAISRTLPPHEGRAEVREVERLYVDSIRSAERSIYLENQYFTATIVTEELARRLAEPDGPEVVVVLPSSLSGWLEQQTMGALAAQAVRRLREADARGRLRVVQPRLPGGTGLCVHAKIAVIDDRLLRVGSANTSNRSMGFDSECDLSIESTPARDVSREIRGVRDALLAEHLGCGAQEVSDAVARTGSLVTALDALSRGERRLDPMPEVDPGWLAEVLVAERPFDPERPLGVDDLVAMFTAGRDPARRRAGWLLPAVGVAVVMGLLVAWHATPLGDLDPRDLALRASRWGEGFGGGVSVALVFAVAVTLLVPVTPLVAASGMIFGTAKGTAIALAGSVLGAALGYGAGRLLWRDAVRRLAGRRLDRISRRLGRRGLLSSAALRLVPIAPFGVVNVVVGATHIRSRDFLLGTLLGMAPGTFALAFFGDRALTALRDPDWGSVSVAVAVAVAIFGAGAFLERRIAASGGVSPSSR